MHVPRFECIVFAALTVLLLILLRMGAIEGGDDVRIRGKNEEKIFVSVRLRPLNQKEIARNDVSEWECINDNTIIYKNDNVFMHNLSKYPTAYKFDRVFGGNCSTRQVYKEGVREVALSVVNGINSSIFAYGQTGSGKTFSMTGITEYTITDIYDHMKEHTEREYYLKFSAMEIYNESVRDLLSTDSTPLRLLDDPERGTIVEKLTEATVRDWNHVRKLLSVCAAQRQIGETSLNATSSRSHQIIRLTIESSARDLLGKDNSSTLVAAVNFVDLAGSECASQSLSAGTRLKEGSHINQSLLTLGTVIHKLSKGINGHIPYRDSKLTRILQSSLGGNARTAIISTVSPARSHVEQSRNTLSFASCAKEVSTDAHVNVVMSDKALVKHLQRELARLDSELSSPGSTLSTFPEPNFSALLREKDRKIEKLEKEVKYLKMQRDAAQSEVHNLLQHMGDEGRTPSRVGFSQYPHLRIHQSPDYEQPLQDIGRTFGTFQSSDGYSTSSFSDSYLELPFVNEFLQNDKYSRFLIGASQYIESESNMDMEEGDGKSNGSFDDVFKEFINNYLDINCLSSETNTEISPRMTFKLKNHHKEVSPASEDRGVVYRPSREDRGLLSPLLKVNRHVPRSLVNGGSELASTWTNEASKLTNPPYVNPSPELPSPLHEQMKKLPLSGSLNLKRGFKTGLSISVSSPWLENVENNENTPPKGSKKDFTGRPQGKVNVQNFNAFVDGSDSSAGTATETELKSRRQITSTHSNISSDTDIVETKIRAKLQHDDQASDTVSNETEGASYESVKIVKDVNMDPVEDCLGQHGDWSSEFKRLQREIIKLWDTCNVSLVHRSHFFLLFKGDIDDHIYMEVELRRLSFLKETFSHGNQTAKDGHLLNLASSEKALLSERQMLTAKMQKQLSNVERDTLFVDWGVPLDGKNRRLQLVNLLWTDTEDMDHITRSANVVSKLVGHPTHEKKIKEMFSFNFGHWKSRKPRSLKDSLSSIL